MDMANFSQTPSPNRSNCRREWSIIQQWIVLSKQKHRVNDLNDKKYHFDNHNNTPPSPTSKWQAGLPPYSSLARHIKCHTHSFPSGLGPKKGTNGNACLVAYVKPGMCQLVIRFGHAAAGWSQELGLEATLTNLVAPQWWVCVFVCVCF